jgi:hypothetical protein
MNRAVRYKKSEIEIWFEKRGTVNEKIQNEKHDDDLFKAVGAKGGE